MRLSWLILGLPCGACDGPSVSKEDGAREAAAPAEPAVPEAPYEVASSPGGMFTAAWRPLARTVPVNELFEIEVLLYEGRGTGQGTEKPLTGAKVQASAWMPEHMHGMSRRPQTVETAPGRYLVRGMRCTWRAPGSCSST
jgi:hypothetical protein